MTTLSTNPSSALTPRETRRVVIAVTAGNALEFYDFMVFGLFAIQIGRTYFPTSDAYVSLLASLATFGSGFVSRPVGAWLIGAYADRAGRKPALFVSMIMMAAGIATMALTPGYAVIGAAAPMIVVLARLVQGFALGGEVGPATAYLLESAPAHRRGIVVSLQRVSQLLSATVGASVGLLLSVILSPGDFNRYGWRIALLLGLAIVPFALYIRKRLPDTADLPEAAEEVAAQTSGFRRTVALGFVINASIATSSYVLSYIATFGQASLKLSPAIALSGQVANNLTALVANVLGAWLSDHVGRRPIMLVSFASIVVVMPLVFGWMIDSLSVTSFVIASSLLAVGPSLGNAAANAAIVESLPKASRAKAYALTYAIPATLFGSSTQLVVTWLSHEHGKMMVVWYPAIYAIAALIAIILMRESAPKRHS